MEQPLPAKLTLLEVDYRLMNLTPEVEDLGELDGLLQTRGELVRELSEAARAEPSDAMRAALERSLYAGSELTRKLAAYRRMLESELVRANHYRRIIGVDD